MPTVPTAAARHFLAGVHRSTLGLVASRIGRTDGPSARRVRWPLERWSPYRRAELHLWRAGALGDVLMCTPTLRQLKERNPGCRVTFYTNYPAPLAGLPFLDAVRPMADLPRGAIQLRYERSLPPRRHLARIMADEIGLALDDVRPSCALDASAAAAIRGRLGDLPRPWIVVARNAGPWTPNKQWPGAHWDRLIDRLTRWASVIETGTQPGPPPPACDPSRYRDLRGQLALEGLIAAIAGADLLIGPPSGPIHVAAAFAVPAVVILGGYEGPDTTRYPGQVSLATDLPCAPCWLRTPCPIDRRCLRQIEPSAVDEAARSLWGQSTGPAGPVAHDPSAAASSVPSHVPDPLA